MEKKLGRRKKSRQTDHIFGLTQTDDYRPRTSQGNTIGLGLEKRIRSSPIGLNFGKNSSSKILTIGYFTIKMMIIFLNLIL